MERVIGMYGTVTEYMGTAYTGRGIVHKYNELIASATETVFLKCPPTNAISTLLNQTGMYYVKRGYDIDKLMNPALPEKTDAIFVKGPNILFLQASHPIALEPSDIGGRHRVVSFYDIYDEEKLREQNRFVSEKLMDADMALGKALQALSEALGIHDEWEKVNIERMMWELHVGLIDSLKEELFGAITLNKKATVTHRIIGSLSSDGARDYIPSITKSLDRRMLIKGLPGTGKSTLMKALGEEAEKRGFDVLYGWCGLDSKGVDLVLFKELSICLIDATSPHAYDPERPGDELLDLVHMCAENQDAEKKISTIQTAYKKKILDAEGYMQTFSQAESAIKATMDLAIKEDIFERKASKLIN